MIFRYAIGGSMHRFRLFASGVRNPLLASIVTLGAGPVFADAPAPAGPVARVYDVEAYDVEGAKLIQVVDVEAAVYPFLGPERSAADIEAARAALEKAYRDRGYASVVVELPAQSVSDNIVRIHVVEATVGRLKVSGARYFSPDDIRRETSALQEGQVPNIALAQTQLADLNRATDRRVTPVLKAGTIPGTVDVDLKVVDSLPLHASVELSNDHNQFTTPLRTTATISYDNLWQLQHSASFTFAVAPENPNDTEIFAGSYVAPLRHSPLTLMLSGYLSNSNLSTIGGSAVLGRGYSVGFHVIDLLPRVAGLTQSISFGFDFKNFNENITVGTAPGSTDLARYLPLTAAYTVERDGEKASTKASLSVTAGTRAIGSNAASVDNKRFRALDNFTHVNVDVTQTETLWHGLVASEHVVGQIADGPLVSSEEFAAGGFSSVRGYLQAEASADEGVTGSVELTTPSLAARWAPVLDDLKIYVFADGGALWLLDPLSEQKSYLSLASAGLGVRIALLRRLKADVALGVPFITGAATHAYRPRATFSLKSDF
jgi:hemolysin activation/secretion protein